jgi:hypothetical protein
MAQAIVANSLGELSWAKLTDQASVIRVLYQDFLRTQVGKVDG